MAENLLSSTIAERFCAGGLSAFSGDPDQLHKVVIG
jgi:hypothetical protein